MPKESNNPDYIFKDLFKNKELIIDLLKNIIDKDWVRDIDFDTLELLLAKWLPLKFLKILKKI